MDTLRKVGAAVAMVAYALLASSGCTAGDSDSDEEEGDVNEAQNALDSHDGQPGSDTADKCMDQCRDVLTVCVDACKHVPRPEQPDCVGTCTAAYGECVHGCGWSRGGCNSLNEADCSPWRHP